MTHTAVSTDLLETLRARGYVSDVSDEDGLRRALEGGPITLYCGYDPTAPSLHVGHLVSIMVLAHFQRAGHRPVVVVGGGTGQIGDPTDRQSARPLLSLDVIQQNVESIRRGFSRYLDFSDGRALLVNNADWLSPLRYLEFLRDVGRHFTVNQLMQHETYRQRFENGSLSFIELNYALVQAYDFLHLNREYGCLLQLGGSDQWFNILAGVELIRRAEERAQAFALTTPLVTASSGRKMSKSEGNAPGLDPDLTSPYDYYQFWRNVEDPDVGRFMRLYTYLPLDEIARFEHLAGADLNRAKERLAYEATRLQHGEEAAEQAQETARARFRGDGEDSGPSVTMREPRPLADLAVEAGLASSRSEAKRFMKAGGLRLDGHQELQDRPIPPTELPALLSIGKRKVLLTPGQDV